VCIEYTVDQWMVPKLFQFIERLGAMLLYVEQHEHFFMSLKLGTVSIVEDIMTYHGLHITNNNSNN
jgi:hypothetical protein